MENTFSPHISNEELAQLPIQAFEGEVTVVDTESTIAEACAYLSQQRIIGFDTETRPAFAKGVVYKVALLQLSSEERAFLFRLNRIALEKPILTLLENEKVVKVGAAIRDDIKTLQRLRRFTPRGFVELQNIVGNYGVAELSLRKMAAITLGIKISKAQRLSNWEAQSLTPAQQSYAATDAWIGQAIYQKLLKTSRKPLPPPEPKL